MTMPIYPEKALRERIRGVVVLRVLVSETGEPVEVRVEAGARADLDTAAVDAARQWRFEPATKGGRPVRSYARLRFPFEGVQFARTPLPQFANTPTN
jgi:protein TonB